MTLISIIDELKKAQSGSYAIPLFDTFDLNSTEGILTALEDRRAPGILAIYSPLLDQPNGRAFTEYLLARALQAKVPVSVMLDHGASYAHCLRAIQYGCCDVMYDGSKLPLAENIATTQAVARAAHAVGISVEAELGNVGHGSEYQAIAAQRKGYTDPEMVAGFVRQTGVDALAVAIGNAHGLYAGEPHLDLGLLSEIRARVDLPLVLHGGTGISEEQFRAVIAGGVCKINIATDLYMTAGRRIGETVIQQQRSYLDLIPVVTQSIAERCMYYIELFGATGKASA